jgi:hypothetical protein
MNTSGDTTYKEKRSHAEQIRLEVKKEWASLWKNKYKDEKKAEGISTKDYHWLSVEQGQVIYASRECNSLDYEDILEKNLGKSFQAKFNPHPETGGWRKFAKKEFSRKVPKREKPKIKFDLNQQQRKHGRGWLNQIRINKKINGRI